MGVPPVSPLERRIHEDGGLPDQVIVVVDEASMVGTRPPAALSDRVEAAEGRLILIGDPHQLPELHAGGLFRVLSQLPSAMTLTENHRQQEMWGRQALGELRDGSLPGWYLDQGHLEHGYAPTGHKAQGVTVDRTFSVVGSQTSREWFHVVMSRGRESNTDYLTATARGDTPDQCGHVPPPRRHPRKPHRSRVGTDPTQPPPTSRHRTHAVIRLHPLEDEPVPPAEINEW